MPTRIRQAFAAALLAFFINIALAAGAGNNRSEDAVRLWLSRPAIVLAYDPDEISGELSFLDDYLYSAELPTADGWLTAEAVDLLDSLELSDSDLPYGSDSAYEAWLTGGLSPRQAIYQQVVPHSLELATDEYDLRWKQN